MALLNPLDIHILSFPGMFEQYKVSEKDIAYYNKLIAEGNEEKALDLFLEKYMLPVIEKYNGVMKAQLIEAEKGELKAQSRRNAIKIVALLSFGVLGLLKKNFNEYTKKALAPVIFDKNNIKTKKVKDIILESTLSQFETVTTQALSGTQAYLLRNIRNMQKEMITFNQTTEKISAAQLDQATASFLGRLKTKFPEYQKMKDGKLIASAPYDAAGHIRYYKLENYMEMSVRTTILNVGRSSAQINILNKEAERSLKKERVAVNVAEFYLADNRTLKTGVERESCKEVLSKTKYGVSLVALDSKTADILGIPLLDDAVSRGTFGPFCRHLIRAISVSLRKRLEKIIKEAA